MRSSVEVRKVASRRASVFSRIEPSRAVSRREMVDWFSPTRHASWRCDSPWRSLAERTPCAIRRRPASSVESHSSVAHSRIRDTMAGFDCVGLGGRLSVDHRGPNEDLRFPCALRIPATRITHGGDLLRVRKPRIRRRNADEGATQTKAQRIQRRDLPLPSRPGATRRCRDGDRGPLPRPRPPLRRGRCRCCESRSGGGSRWHPRRASR